MSFFFPSDVFSAFCMLFSSPKVPRAEAKEVAEAEAKEHEESVAEDFDSPGTPPGRRIAIIAVQAGVLVHPLS